LPGAVLNHGAVKEGVGIEERGVEVTSTLRVRAMCAREVVVAGDDRERASRR